MPTQERVYRCVCGEDLRFRAEDPPSACPRCGRERFASHCELLAAAETVVAGPGSAEGKPAPRADDDGGQQDAGPSLVGRKLDHFEILEEIGRGGMGVVYRAVDRSLERYVALKVISSREAAERPELLDAFVHEARSQARINHEGVATLYYVGRHEGMPYFAMEYVPGEDLYSRVARSGPLPFELVIEVGLQLVRALREASARGITHRDIKPANIILTPSGRVKLTDFGLSKAEAAGVSRAGGLPLSGVHSFAGSPHYISPEQARGGSTDLRSDVYSVGATLYHLAYGTPPFDAPNAMAVVARHLGDPVSFPKHPPRDVSLGFPALIERMLAKHPEDRFQTYDELERALLAHRPAAQRVATLLQRVLATVVDYALVSVFFGLAFLLVGAYITTREKEEVSQAEIEHAIAIVLAVVFSVPLLAHVLWQAALRRSPGKHVARVVIAGKLRAPRRARLAIRATLSLLPLTGLALAAILAALRLPLADVVVWVAFLASLVDNLWALTNRPRRTLRDLLLGTVILREPAPERDGKR